MLLQLLDTALERDLVTRYNHGAWDLLSCSFIIVLALTPLVGEMPEAPDHLVLIVMTLVQVAAATIVIFALSLIDRRPDVYHDEKLVERQTKASLWTWSTFSWSSNLLDEAAVKLINMEDMPAPNHATRSKDVTAWFRRTTLKDTTPLWVLIAWNLRWRLLWQWFVIAVSCFFDIGPQFAMLRLLQYLEARQGFDAVDPRAWLWVGVLFLITVGSTILDHRIMWSMFSDVAIPMRNVLTTLLFDKVTKLKDIKEPPKSDKEGGKDAGKADEDTKSSKPKEEKATLQTSQDVVNMFAVDTNLVAVFAGNQQMYLNFAVRFILAILFLWLLVGWESMFAGMFSMALTFPVNKWLGNRYAGYQKALMKARDKKTAVINEALTGIRQIKFSAIESQWSEKIEKVREDELSKIWATKKNTVIMGVASDLTPVLFAVFALATYSYLKGDLLPSIAFTALSLFIQLEGLTGMLPYLLVMGVNAKVSCDRIDKFLHAPEKEQNTFPGHSISFNNATISFPSASKDEEDNKFILRDLNLEFPNKALSVISGPTGAGKSLLLSAILGEADVLSGHITVPTPTPLAERFDTKATAANWILPSAVAYVSQTPWIENATIKNNILFGLPDDPVRYEQVIQACALTKDLAMFEDGDSTEVGAQGISLSGGQKWRLTLARAFYSRAGILILDDVFSALDAHVGKEIYENALMGPLAEGRTRILVTHHVALCLPRAKYAVRLSARGTLEHAGLISDLKQTGSFQDILEAAKDEVDSEGASTTGELISSATTLHDEPQGSVVVEDSTPAVAKAPPKKLVEEEKRERGTVSRSVYKEYLIATGGFPFWTSIAVIFFAAQTLTLGRSWWIKIWTSSNEKTSHMTSFVHSYGIQTQLMGPPLRNSSSPVQISSNNSTLAYYLGIYVAISLISVFVDAIRYLTLFLGALRGSRRIFKEMTYSVLRTPLRWLDTVPTGRILNRFTADFQNVDSQLSNDFGSVFACALEMVGILVAAFVISPWMLVLSVLLLGICGHMGRRYINGARSIKRLESIQKSPMISHFSSSLEGISTIRAFANTPVFVDRMALLIDSFATSTWHNWLFNNWIGFRTAMVGSIFSAAVASFIVSTRGVDSSLAGFALAFALDYRHAAIRVIRILAALELDMNAAERIFEYSHLETENLSGIDNLRASWPEEGKLEVEDLDVGYGEGLPSILKGLTFKAASNQRIGVVGRTGAGESAKNPSQETQLIIMLGKSTLSLALFRFLEARKGSITIDGIDISTIKLHDLRTRLSIIPQDPVLFSGTIRSNLDPFDEFSDHQLREALARVHLTPSNTSTPIPEIVISSSSETSSTTAAGDDAKANINIFLNLSSPISSAGANLSQGQKQLLCLARAILSRPRLLLLDEATSAVDMVTDALIQRSIREEFANTTLLVVAHRLSTVADFDRILVMKDGIAAEFGSPKELMDIDGVFKSMIAQSGEREELESTIMNGSS
jgi:ABC-type multidrug transport system fused ATPase/permease subunit